MRGITLMLALAAMPVPGRPAAAQETGGFAVLRGADTVAAESFQRDGAELAGSLTRQGAAAGERLHYKATLLPDQSAALIELSAWRAADPEDMPARQNTRIIFKDDSVAVDDATSWSGVRTVVLPTARAAIAYLNLSVAFLEQATRRAEAATGDSLAVPFFNLGGGQTVTGLVRRLGSDSASIRIGQVEFRLQVDAAGRILGGAVPSQGLTIRRRAGR